MVSERLYLWFPLVLINIGKQEQKAVRAGGGDVTCMNTKHTQKWMQKTWHIKKEKVALMRETSSRLYKVGCTSFRPVSSLQEIYFWRPRKKTENKDTLHLFKRTCFIFCILVDRSFYLKEQKWNKKKSLITSGCHRMLLACKQVFCLHGAFSMFFYCKFIPNFKLKGFWQGMLEKKFNLRS